MRNIVTAALAALMLAACGAKTETQEQAPEPAAAEPVTADDPEAAAPEPAPEPLPPPPTLADNFDWPEPSDTVRIATSKGDIIVELYASKAPKSVANFLQYAADGHYDRTIFHRVVAGFVIQGGGYGVAFNERPTRAPIPYEGDNGLPNYRTTLAMARTRDPNSAAAQWYVNLRDNNDSLDHFANDLGPRYGYTVFGRVIEGMDVADAIGAVATGPGGPFEQEAPQETVVVTSVTRVEAATP
jgi:cyclophilin family peptidyl-prolyl cis-trans isomerase